MERDPRPRADRNRSGVWLGTSNSYNVRNVNTDGTLSNTNAYNGNEGVRPLWWNTATY